MSNLNSNSSITIRTAQLKDIHSVAEVLTTSFHPPQGPLFWLYPLYRLGMYEDLRNRLSGNRPNYVCLVATISDEMIVGTVEIALRFNYGFSLMGGKNPYISNLAVTPAYRRQGIARKLLLKCEQIAHNWGYQKICLHVLADNYQAQQLYYSKGYRLVKEDSSIENWIFNRPQKLLLVKSPNYADKSKS